MISLLTQGVARHTHERTLGGPLITGRNGRRVRTTTQRAMLQRSLHSGAYLRSLRYPSTYTLFPEGHGREGGPNDGEASTEYSSGQRNLVTHSRAWAARGRASRVVAQGRRRRRRAAQDLTPLPRRRCEPRRLLLHLRPLDAAMISMHDELLRLKALRREGARAHVDRREHTRAHMRHEAEDSLIDQPPQWPREVGYAVPPDAVFSGCL